MLERGYIPQYFLTTNPDKGRNNENDNTIGNAYCIAIRR